LQLLRLVFLLKALVFGLLVFLSMQQQLHPQHQQHLQQPIHQQQELLLALIWGLVLVLQLLSDQFAVLMIYCHQQLLVLVLLVLCVDPNQAQRLDLDQNQVWVLGQKWVAHLQPVLSFQEARLF
jgi:cell division protein FtsW (lipid II flippase)